MARLTSVLIALVAAGSLGAAAFSLASRGHPPTPPLDDAYIYLQYARTAAAGHVGSYFPGDPHSGGATSPLWWALLTAAALVLKLFHAPDTTALPTAAFLFDTLAAALTFLLAHRLARRHGVGQAAAWIPAVLCALTPVWLFGSWNGMETGLYGAALLGWALALTGGSILWLALLALVRPEGAALALATLLWLWAARRRKRVPDRFAVPPSRAAQAAVLMAAAFTLLLPWILTGGPASGWAAKALWTEPNPEVRGSFLPRLPYFAARALGFGLTGARPQPPAGVLTDLTRPSAWTAWMWVLFLGGGAVLAVFRKKARGPLVLWIPASLLALAANAWDAQFYRYLVPAYPLLVTAAVAGWFGTASKRTGSPTARGEAAGPGSADTAARRTRPAPLRRLSPFLRPAAGLLVLAVLVGGIWTTPRGLRATTRWLYRGECERMAGTQVQVARWIHDHLPEGTRVATHDVGAIAFLGGRPVVDLVGLVTPAFAGAYRHGEGAMWEVMDRLPPERRPAYAAVVPAWMPYLAGTDWARKRVWALEPGATRSPSQTFEVRELSWPDGDPAVWPDGDLGNRPREHGSAAGRRDRKVMDGLDLADLQSEAAHRFRSLQPQGLTLVRNLGFPQRGSPAMEGGRDLAGPVTFTLHAELDRAAILVARTASARPVRAVVRIADWSDTLAVPRDETHFHEPWVFVPESAVHASIGRNLEIRVDAAGARVFHWWLLQSTLPAE